jgi:predicted nucleic acid-binding protein
VLGVPSKSEIVLTVQVLAEVVPGRLQVHGVTRDPDDNHVLACAVEGEVDFVVSDDRK